MPHSIDTETEPDTGLACLALVARFHGLPTNPEQIAHQSGKPGEPFSSDDILRAARRFGLKSRAIQSNWQRLAKTSLPAIARHNDGHYFIIAGYEGETERLLIQDPLESRPLTLPREIFEAAWCGELILITKRSLLPGQGSRFDFSWFIPAIVKYRRLLSEVLLASFFLQLFALITPLFFRW